MGVRPIILLLLGIFGTSISHAFPSSQPCQKSQFDKLSDLVQKTRVFGTDDRKTFEEYAAHKGTSVSVIEKKFQATGVLDCDGNQSTAQLTESNSVITFSRHLFTDKNCNDRPARKAKDCVFYTHDGTGWNIAHKLNMDSLKMGQCTPDKDEGDWAVLRLQKPAKGIRPYKAVNADELGSPIDVVNPAAFSDDFKVGDNYPRLVNECAIHRIEIYARTSCDTGGGASGSANLIEKDGNLSLVAIVIGTGKENGRDVNISTPLKGEFYEAVMAAAGKTTNSAPAQSKDKGI